MFKIKCLPLCGIGEVSMLLGWAFQTWYQEVLVVTVNDSVMLGVVICVLYSALPLKCTETLLEHSEAIVRIAS
jgi:hypothetical protein